MSFTCNLEALRRAASCFLCDGRELLTAEQTYLLCSLANGQAPPFELQVAGGLVEGVSRIVIMGHNTDVDLASLPEDVWEAGGLYPFQSIAQSLEIVSTSAADAAAGTGAQTVRVDGLDSNWAQQFETVTLNGVGVVPLIKQYLRVNSCECVTSGSGLLNAGVITLRVAGGGATQAVIDTGEGRAMQAVYTVPAGKTAHFISRECSILRSAITATCEIFVNVRDASTSQPWIVRNLIGLQSNGTSSLVKGLPFLRVGQRNDFRATVNNVSANDTSISATFEVFLVTN